MGESGSEKGIRVLHARQDPDGRWRARGVVTYVNDDGSVLEFKIEEEPGFSDASKETEEAAQRHGEEEARRLLRARGVDVDP